MSKGIKKTIQKMIDTAPSQWVDMFQHHGLGKKPKVDVLIDKVLEKTASGASSGSRGEAKYTVPRKVKQEAFEGLLLAHKHNWSSTSGIGLVRAMQLVLHPKIWERSVKRMHSYFTRHRNNRNSKAIKTGKKTWGPKNPTRGYIAHMAWGGDSGEKWASKQIKKINPRSRTGPIIGRDWNQENVRQSPEIAEARRLLVERPVDRKSPEFVEWFGDSVVKSKHRGVPTIVYRGTADIRNFIKTGTFRGGSRYLGPEAADSAYFFTDKYAIAKTYATDKMPYESRNSIPAVAGFYLRMENPLVIDGEGRSFRKTEKFIKRAYNAGYDGLIIENTLDAYNVGTTPSSVYVVWTAKNVKLADGRDGPYGETNDTRINPKKKRKVSEQSLTNPQRRKNNNAIRQKALDFVDQILPDMTDAQKAEYADYLYRETNLDRVEKIVSEAQSRIPKWNDSDVRIDVRFDKNLFSYDVDIRVGVYVGDTYFTVMGLRSNTNSIVLGDVAEWYEDFSSSEQMLDYQNLINEIRTPYSTSSQRRITVFTAQPFGFDQQAVIPKGTFFTSRYDDALGIASERGGRDVFELRIPIRSLIMTKEGPEKWYQLTEDLRNDGEV